MDRIILQLYAPQAHFAGDLNTFVNPKIWYINCLRSYPGIKHLSLFLLITVLLANCKGDKSLSSEDKLSIITSVRKTLENYNEDVRRGGLLAELRYLDSTSDFFWVPPGFRSAIGYDSVVTIIRQNATRYSSVSNTWENLMIFPLDKTVAVYTGRLRSITSSTSGLVSNVLLLETGFLMKRGGEWKLSGGQTNVADR